MAVDREVEEPVTVHVMHRHQPRVRAQLLQPLRLCRDTREVAVRCTRVISQEIVKSQAMTWCHKTSWRQASCIGPSDAPFTAYSACLGSVQLMIRRM